MDNDYLINDELLKKIDNIELIPENELKNMDFYDLAYYMQTLNIIDSLSQQEEGDENV